MHFNITPHFSLICTGLTKKASGNLSDNAIRSCSAFGVPVVVCVHMRAPSTCQFSWITILRWQDLTPEMEKNKVASKHNHPARLVGCCSVSLHFRCWILRPHSVFTKYYLWCQICLVTLCIYKHIGWQMYTTLIDNYDGVYWVTPAGNISRNNLLESTPLWLVQMFNTKGSLQPANAL